MSLHPDLAKGRGAGSRTGRATRSTQPNRIDKGTINVRTGGPAQAFGQKTVAAHGQLASAFGSFFGLGQQIIADAGRKQAVKDTAAINAEADRMRAEIAKDPEKAQAAYAAKDWSAYDEGSDFFGDTFVVTARRKALARTMAIRLNGELQEQILAAEPGVDPYQLQDEFITANTEGAEGEWAAEFASQTATMANKSILTLEGMRKVRATSEAKTQARLGFRAKWGAGEIVFSPEGLMAERTLIAASIPNTSAAEAAAIAKDGVDDMIMELASDGDAAAIRMATQMEEFGGLTLAERKPDQWQKALDLGRAKAEDMTTRQGWAAHNEMRERIFEATLPGFTGGREGLYNMLAQNDQDLNIHGSENKELLGQRGRIVRLINALGDTAGYNQYLLQGGVHDTTKENWNSSLPGLLDEGQRNADADAIGMSRDEAEGVKNTLVSQHGLGPLKAAQSNTLASSDNAEAVGEIFSQWQEYDAAGGTTLLDGGVATEEGYRMYKLMDSQQRAGKNPMLARKHYMERDGNNTLRNHYANRTDEDNKQFGDQRLRDDTETWFGGWADDNLNEVLAPFVDRFGVVIDDDLSWSDLSQEAKNRAFEIYNEASFMVAGQPDELAALNDMASSMMKNQLSIVGVDPNTGEAFVGLNVDPLGGKPITREQITNGQEDMHSEGGNALFMNMMGGQATLTADTQTRSGVGGLRIGVLDEFGAHAPLTLVPGDRAWIRKESIEKWSGSMRQTRDLDPLTGKFAQPIIRIEAEDGQGNVLAVVAPDPRAGGQSMVVPMSPNAKGVYDASIGRWTGRYYGGTQELLDRSEELRKAAEARIPTPGPSVNPRGGQVLPERQREHGITGQNPPDTGVFTEPSPEIFPSSPLFESSAPRGKGRKR